MSALAPAPPPAPIDGAHGRAWPSGAPSETIEQQASLEAWIVHAPYGHPAWSQYLIGLCHLRDLAGARPAHRYAPAATHEVFVIALDPRHQRRPDTEGERRTLRFLTPANFAGQFASPSDAAAILHLRETVQLVVDGTLNPDTDFRRLWMRRFPYHGYGESLPFGALRRARA